MPTPTQSFEQVSELSKGIRFAIWILLCILPGSGNGQLLPWQLLPFQPPLGETDDNKENWNKPLHGKDISYFEVGLPESLAMDARMSVSAETFRIFW